MVIRTTLALSVLVVLVGCYDDPTNLSGTLRGPLVLAVRSEPAEARPGAPVAYEALIADGTGVRAGLAPTWAVCLAPKPATELGPVAPVCARGDDAAAFVSLGAAPSATTTVPDRACRLFGPDVPPTTSDGSAPRPVDPDETGGFYLPVRVGLGRDAVVHRMRLSCGLAGASREVLSTFEATYRPNVNPTPTSLTLLRGAVDAPLRVGPGERVTLRLTWPACGDEACAGAESYVAFDPAGNTLVPRREAMRVAWYTTAGAFVASKTGRDEGDHATTSDATWTAPAGGGDVTVIAVLRDARGGVGWIHATIGVTSQP